MRADLVVVHAPGFDDGGGFSAISEPLLVETLIAKPAVEPFVRAVLPGFSGCGLGSVNPVVGQPAQDGGGHELGTVVGA